MLERIVRVGRGSHRHPELLEVGEVGGGLLECGFRGEKVFISDAQVGGYGAIESFRKIVGGGKHLIEANRPGFLVQGVCVV